MRSKRLLKAVGGIRDQYVEEANETPAKKTYGWVKWVAAAACLVVVALMAAPLIKVIFQRANSAGYNTEDRMHKSYDEFSAIVSDEVFDAFVSSEVAREHNLSFKTLWFTNAEDEFMLESAFIVLDSPDDYDEWAPEAPEGQSVHIIRHFGTLLADSDNNYFKGADEFGIRKDYQVEGVEVQKFYRRDYETYLAEHLIANNPEEPGYLEQIEVAKTSDAYGIYWERVNIGGTWYYVFARNESAADSAATALAAIASSL